MICQAQACCFANDNFTLGFGAPNSGPHFVGGKVNKTGMTPFSVLLSLLEQRSITFL